MSQALVETKLGNLEVQIAEETRALEDLRRRTHTLEVEIAGWRREQPPAPPRRVVPTAAIELMFGGVLGVLCGVMAKVLMLLLGHG